MFCQNCGNKVQKSAKFCNKCGARIDEGGKNIIKKVKNNTKINDRDFSKVVPVQRFIIFSLATFGIYEMFWFYRQWKLLKEESGVANSPFWRSFFGSVWAGDLAGKLKKFLEERSIPCDYSPTLIGVSYFILAISYKLPIISLFSFVPIIPLVNSINTYWESREGGLVIYNFKWWQILLIMCGLIWMILVTIGSFE
ncbi:MAG: zinc ribbon domain-containing protein [Candidatus Paceibacterota bacterium]|jgi:hypothetical protein